jgi:hypothetical protein
MTETVDTPTATAETSKTARHQGRSAGITPIYVIFAECRDQVQNTEGP